MISVVLYLCYDQCSVAPPCPGPETDCLTRQCCGPARPFTMEVTDNQGMQLVQLHRPLRCHSCCLWGCWLQQMEIHSPPGVPIGQVKQL
ncbi:Phospholipid scramblase 2 [Nucella lapillus]